MMKRKEKETRKRFHPLRGKAKILCLKNTKRERYSNSNNTKKICEEKLLYNKVELRQEREKSENNKKWNETKKNIK